MNRRISKGLPGVDIDAAHLSRNAITKAGRAAIAAHHAGDALAVHNHLQEERRLIAEAQRLGLIPDLSKEHS
jgi:hypothetical protein